MARMGMEMKRAVEETQSAVLQSLQACGTTQEEAHNQVLDTIVECDENTAVAKLGNVGKPVLSFAQQITLRHPDVADISKSDSWDSFSRDFFNAVGGDQGAKDRLNSNVYKPIIRSMSCPKPRLVKDSIRRKELRGIKNQVRNIGMKHVYMLGENGFYGKPSNFEMFIRNSQAHLAEAESLSKNEEIFTKNNMPEVAHAVRRRIKDMQGIQNDSYLGFHRIKPPDAAIIAARMMDLPWNELYFLSIPFKYFERNYWPEVKERRDEEKAKDEIKRLLVMKDKKMAFIDSVAFQYQPRLYPLSSFPGMPKQVESIISTVESLQELNGNPAFDYYWVLVPSININHPYFRQKDGWKVYARRQVEDGWTDLELKSYTNEYDAALALDSTLVCDGYFVPVVLGERDGKCYFLSLWR